MIKLLSLEDCENTRIGDQTSRGISGGEKRRLSIGEVLVTRARVLLLDEVSVWSSYRKPSMITMPTAFTSLFVQITNGLDSTVAYKVR